MHLSISLFWPLKAKTVLMEDSTSSATAPALAYALCSLDVKLVNTCLMEKNDEKNIKQKFVELWLSKFNK